MPKPSPGQRKFMVSLTNERRGDRRFTALIDIDGRWQMIVALRNLGMMKRDQDNPLLYRFTNEAFDFLKLPRPVEVSTTSL